MSTHAIRITVVIELWWSSKIRLLSTQVLILTVTSVFYVVAHVDGDCRGDGWPKFASSVSSVFPSLSLS